MSRIQSFMFFYKLYRAFGHSLSFAARTAWREAHKPIQF